jgi:hypothetical protein
MGTISFNPFMVFCKSLSLKGQQLPTKGGRKKFVLSSVKNDCLYYYIVSSKSDKCHSTKREIEDVLNHYKITGSLRPVDYLDLTRHASYILKLMELYLQNQSKQPSTKKK